MELITIESAAFKKLYSDLIKEFQQALKAAQTPTDDWISTQQAMQLLGVKSKSHMQKLRDTNAIRFSQHSRKIIKYSKASILAYLKRNIPTY